MPSSMSTSSRLSFRRPGWGARVRLVLLAIAGIYLTLAAALWFNQKDILYHPSEAQLLPREAWIAPVRISTPDGESLVGWYSEPEAGCPTMLFFDGNAGRPEIQSGRWRRMQEQGVGFLAVYYRGYSGSTGSPSEEGLHLDAQAGLAWLMRRGIESTDVIVHGFSLGSGPATRLAATNAVGALVLEAPYSSMSALVAEKLPLFPYDLILQNRFRSDEWIKALDEPVLMVHGTEDRLVPMHHSDRLMAQAPEPSELVRIDGADHATLVRDGLYEAVWPFLERHWTGSLEPGRNCAIIPGAQRPEIQVEARISQAHE